MARDPRLEAQHFAAIDACAEVTEQNHRYRQSIVVAYDVFERVLPLDAARDVRMRSESVAKTLDFRLSARRRLDPERFRWGRWRRRFAEGQQS